MLSNSIAISVLLTSPAGIHQWNWFSADCTERFTQRWTQKWMTIFSVFIISWVFLDEHLFKDFFYYYWMEDIEITNQYKKFKRLKNVGCRCLHIWMKSIRFGFVKSKLLLVVAFDRNAVWMPTFWNLHLDCYQYFYRGQLNNFQID